MSATYALIGFLGGIGVEGVFHLGVYSAVFILVLGFGVLGYIYSTQQKQLVFVVLMLFGAALGIVRMHSAYVAQSAYAHSLDAQLGQEVVLEGIVFDEPDVRETNTKLIIELQEGQRVLVQASAYIEARYGDVVEVSGELARPENFSSENGTVFDYVAYLAKDDVHYLLTWAHVKITGQGAGNPLTAALYSIKAKYVRALGTIIPEPEAGLAAGITVGSKQALGGELLDVFRRVGLIHIVVLSGFNITVMIVFLLQLLRFVPRVPRFVAVGAIVSLFTILVGADAPVVRAALMGLLGVLALSLRRQYALTRALLVVAVGMVAWNPFILLDDIAFQLSFVATLGLVYLAPPLIMRMQKLPQWIAEILSATIAAQIAVLPLLIYYMGEVSVVAVLVNVLTLPLIPLAMLTSFIAGVLGMVSVTIALPFAYLTYALLHYVMFVVRIFDALPFTTVLL